MAEQIARKKRLRASHKASATKMISRVEESLATEEPSDPVRLSQVGMSLKEKLNVIKTLDSKILELVDDADLVKEIDLANKLNLFYDQD